MLPAGLADKAVDHGDLGFLSLLQVLEKGPATEIDFINGIVCRKGDEHGIDTPYNDKVVELVKREEATKVLHTMQNKEEFLPLLAADEQ